MRSRIIAILTAVLVGIFLVGCADQKSPLRIGSKPFTESEILAEMVAQLAENSGIPVERKLGYGYTNEILEATKQGVIDIYPEYNGTALIFLGQAPTSDGEQSTAIVNKLFNPLGIQMSGKFGFSNDYAITVTSEWANEHALQTISDLVDLGEPLNFAVDSDFTNRPADGLPHLLRRYGMEANSTLAFDLENEGKDKIISALLDGSANVAELWDTDGQIAEYNLVVLEDDLKFFPVYDAAPLVRSAVLDTHPELAGVLNSLAGAITAGDMQRLNKSVELDAQSVVSVASAFLAGKGLLPEGAALANVETLNVVGDPSLAPGSSTARALRAIRTGFPGSDIKLVNSPDPTVELAAAEARVAVMGTESFFELTESGPVLKDRAQAFAVLGHKSGHLFVNRFGGAINSLADMSKIATQPEGSGSAIVLEMMLNSLQRSDVEVIHEQATLAEQLQSIANGSYDGVFIMAAQGDRQMQAGLQIASARLLGLDEWSEGGHAAQYSFIRPATIAANTYLGQPEAIQTVSTQQVLAGAVETQQEAGEVGPGTAGVGNVAPISASTIMKIREALGSQEIIDPAVPVHSALVPTIEVVDKSLPFKLDISIINILMIVFTIWVLYTCFLPSPRTFTMPDEDKS